MEPADHPPIRSFRPRRRKLGVESLAAYERGRDRWLVAERGPLLDPAIVFGRSAPLVLEIGFGGGESLVELAAARPERDVIGVEVHQPGIVRVLQEIERLGLDNIRIVEGDALLFFERLGPASLAEVTVFFPDPWPKARHRPRRIVRPEVVAALAERMAPGAELHLATDWADFAEQTVEICGGEARLAGGPIPRPAWRPVTRFETRGLAEGRPALDFRYVRRPTAD